MTLGQLLKRMRTQKRLSAKQVLEKANIDVSLALFSQWENDKKLPNPSNLRSLCKSLGINTKLAFHLWAQSQMPDDELKKMFVYDTESVEAPLAFQEKDPTSLYPANCTKTIELRDIPFLLQHPVAVTIMLRTLAVYNKSQKGFTLERLVANLDLDKDEAKYLIDELVSRRYISKIHGLYRPPENIKYFFTPETKEYEALRQKRMRYHFDRVLRNTNIDRVRKGQAFRANFTSKLSPEDLGEFMEGLKRLSNQFLTASEEAKEDQKYFQFVGVVGPEYENQ